MIGPWPVLRGGCTDRLLGERGGIALTLGVLLTAVGAVVALLLLAVVDLATTSGRAGTAADAAALAAIGSSPVVGGDGQPCLAAAALATANGARLTRCLADAAAGWPLRVEVHVVARPSSPWLQRLDATMMGMSGRSAAVARPAGPPGR